MVSDRLTQSISAEDTLEVDVGLGELEPVIRRMAEKAWAASRKETRVARTVVLKLKTSDFRTMTRSYTPLRPVADCEELIAAALMLRGRVVVEKRQLFRLVGVGLSNFREVDETGPQSDLFEERQAWI